MRKQKLVAKDGTTPDELKDMLMTACQKNLPVDLSKIEKLTTPVLQVLVSASIHHGVDVRLTEHQREELFLYGIRI